MFSCLLDVNKDINCSSTIPFFINGYVSGPKDLERVFIISFIQFSRSVVSNSLRPHGLQHSRPPCPSPTLGVYSNSYPLSRWCHLTISSSVIPFNFSQHQCLPVSQLFPSVGQNTGASASASVLPVNIQHCSPWGWTGWISLQSKGLSGVFSNTKVQKHQFFSA